MMVLLGIGIALFLVLGGITAYIAVTKGYNPIYWFFTAGPIGLIVVLSLPNTTGDKMGPEEAVAARKRGNLTAVAFVAIQLLWLVGDLLLHPLKSGMH